MPPPLREKAASLALHQQMNRLLDNVTRNFGSGFGFPTHFGWPETWPHFEVSENDNEIAVVAELPGFEENNVEVWVHDGGLTLKGDKKEQKENDGGVFSSKRERKPFRRWLRLAFRCGAQQGEDVVQEWCSHGHSGEASSPMKIAQVAPLFESVPPRRYDGTERIVSYLTEELVRRGHDVTLFASGDSATSAELVSCCDEALRLNPKVRDPLPYQIMQLEKLRQRADDFDVVHFHTDLLQFPLIRGLAGRTVTTLHGRLDLPDLMPFYREFRDIPLVSISKAQRWPMPDVAWVGNVPHGLPRDLLPFQPFSGGDYLAFLGRISPEKRPDRAIQIAMRAGLTLKIAAKVDHADQDYWEQRIRPLI